MPETSAERTPLHALSRFPVADTQRIARLNAFREELLELLAEDDPTTARYGAASEVPEAALCCAVDYDPDALAHIPQEILDIDYGCGDPTVFATSGQTVLDLGSGSGKHAFMIARQVGPSGRVIGVDKTPEMLAKSRAAIPTVMANLGHAEANVSFRAGHIENLTIDRERLGELLADADLGDYDGLERLQRALEADPLVPTGSVDLVVSNCVLNLVDDRRKRRLFDEIFRVLTRGGSVAISDIVADRPIPAAMKADPVLWSGCLSGAFQWDEFHRAFAAAGFHGMQEIQSRFWQRVAGINFFSVTIRAWKGKQGPCYETNRSALYRGPFSRVVDDDAHVFERGVWTPVCEKTAELLSRAPYAAFFNVTPALSDPAAEIPFDCGPGAAAPRVLDEAARRRLDELLDAGECCADGACC